MSLLAPTLQAFFTDRLINQRDVSPRTITAYRDTFRLLLAFIEQQTGKQPFQLDLADLDAPLIGAFLTHLEHGPPQHAPDPQRPPRGDPFVLPIRRTAPPRAPRHDRQDHGDPDQTPRAQRPHLPHQPEIEALLQAPDRATWLGRRDHTLLLTVITTGVRVSELDRHQAQRRDPDTRRAAPPSPRQRPQKPHHAAEGRDRHRAQNVARRTPRRPETPCSRPAKDAALSQTRSRSSPSTPRRGSRLPVARRQTRHPAHPQTHQRDAPPSPARRHRHDRALARPREHQDHLHLPTRRNQLKQEAIDRTATIGTPPGHTNPPTGSSPSSTDSDYPEQPTPEPRAQQAKPSYPPDRHSP